MMDLKPIIEKMEIDEFIDFCKLVAFEMHRREITWVTTDNEAFNDKRPDYNIPALSIRVDGIDSGNCPCGLKGGEHDLQFHYKTQYSTNKFVKKLTDELDKDEEWRKRHNKNSDGF